MLDAPGCAPGCASNSMSSMSSACVSEVMVTAPPRPCARRAAPRVAGAPAAARPDTREVAAVGLGAPKGRRRETPPDEQSDRAHQNDPPTPAEPGPRNALAETGVRGAVSTSATPAP